MMMSGEASTSDLIGVLVILATGLTI